MTKLLSEQELRAKIRRITLNLYTGAYGKDSPTRNATDAIVALFQREKQAWGEYVDTTPTAPEFGDYVWIEQKRYVGDNEDFQYKVINTMLSNAWKNVPVDGRDQETHLHDHSEPVVNVIGDYPLMASKQGYRKNILGMQ